MEIVIEISETLKKIADEEDIKTFSHFMWSVIVMDAIKNGTPLPKGHGKLKDVDAIHKEIERLQNGIAKNGHKVHISRDQYKGMCYSRGIINDAPTIIEADGGGEDEVSD